MSTENNSLQSHAAATRYWAALVIGIAGFILALYMGESTRAWSAFLVNLLFFLGIAQGAIVAESAFFLAQGRWGGKAIYRLAESFSGFLVPGFLLFWLLFFGRHQIFPWVDHPIERLSGWLNVPFLFLRDGLGLAWMTLTSRWLVKAAREPEAQAWMESASEIDLPPPSVRRLAPAVAISYAVVYSLLAFDLVMSLSPRWYSTLFGAFFFAGAFWSGLVAMGLLLLWARNRVRPESRIRDPQVLHDLGKMVFAFSVFWVYLGFSQYLPIWYGDMPVETFFVVPRFNALPWGALGWTAFTLVWATPFVVLMGARPKRTPAILGTVCALGLIGMWIERYVLIVPSLFRYHVPFGWVEVLVTVGFIGGFALATRAGREEFLAAAEQSVNSPVHEGGVS